MAAHSEVLATQGHADVDDGGINIGELMRTWSRHWRTLLASAVACTLIGVGLTFVVTPRWTSHVTFLPPAQQQSSAAAALSSLGALAGAAGAARISSPAEQYIALMHSESVTNRLIDRFNLMKVYDYDLREKTRKKLDSLTNIAAGKKDGLLTVEVQDEDPKRAAAIANQYVEELRQLTSIIAVTEAQQRRKFFEGQLLDTKNKLIAAQTELQKSGFNEGALRTQPNVSGETYARLRAELATAEVRHDSLRSSLADTAPEVQREAATVAALKSQLDALEHVSDGAAQSPDYVGRYREFKYQETLFDSLARQFELARIDESREGGLIQVIDPAHPAERRSYPRRAYFAAGGLLVGLLLAAAATAWRDRRRMRPATDPVLPA